MRITVSCLVFFALSAPVQAETRVIDGDTLELNGEIFRLNGIDAPEHGQTCGKWPCGKAATETLVEIVKGNEIFCEGRSEDGYGRTIATCFANGKDIGADLIDKGMAWAFVRYSDKYVDLEKSARDREDGIWSGTFVEPWTFREARWKDAAASEGHAPAGCPIKGNITKNGKIYHAPWSPWYDRTRINLSKGERWFCSEADAVAAGWRAPYWN